MLLPDFDSKGDLPAGVHRATLKDVVERFGHGTPQREDVTSRLLRVYEIAQGTGKLERFVLFGSYVTQKPAPNDIDIILICVTISARKTIQRTCYPFLIISARRTIWVQAFFGFALVQSYLRVLMTLWRTGR